MPAPADAGLVALAATVLEALRGRGLTLSTAESCTGGLVGHALTEVAGASDVYRGGVVSYADDAKVALLGVPPAALAAHGAVSAEVAVAMAEGARARLGTDVATAVTGIAGPSGGTPDKPVGLTFVAVADERGHDVRRHLWSGDRGANKRASAEAALAMVLERLGRATL
ncbi:MAG: CinA family protein [Candidatus Limnocylindrales bacterium]